MDYETIFKQMQAAPFSGKRRLVAVAGPPASGKSTIAETLADGRSGVCVVPMDGFHLDNATLDRMGLRARKGAPETFDAKGFLELLQRLKVEDTVPYPLFDRAQDQVIENAGQVTGADETVIVEGNYLLLDQPIWRDIAALWDFTVFLKVPNATLEERLIKRWTDHGFFADDAAQKANSNDLPNARLINAQSLPADITLT